MVLAFVWDETASGTARSNTEVRPLSWSAPRFCMGWDRLWDTEELNLGDLNPHVPGDLHEHMLNKGFEYGWILNPLFNLYLSWAPRTGVLRSPTWCSLLFQRQSHPIMKGDQITCAVYRLCCSSLSQRQSCPIIKEGADQPCTLTSVLLIAVPEAILSHTKTRRISFTRCYHRRAKGTKHKVPTSVLKGNY